MNYRKGAITLYFSVIFLSVVLVTVTTIDSARMAYSHASAQRAVNIAAQNVLSKYDYELKEEFGMFGYNKENIQNDAEFYIKNSSRFAPKSVKVSAHDYNYEHSKEQVLEYMKYRAPVNLVLEGAHKMFGIFDRLQEDAQDMELVGKNAEAQSEALEFYEYLNQNVRGRLVGIKQNDSTHSFEPYSGTSVRKIVKKKGDEKKSAYGNELDQQIPVGISVESIKDDLKKIYNTSGSGTQIIGSYPELKGIYREIQNKESEIPNSIREVNLMFERVYDEWEEQNKNNNEEEKEENPYEKDKWYLSPVNFVLKKEIIDKYSEILSTDNDGYLSFFKSFAENEVDGIRASMEKVVDHYKRLKHFIDAQKLYTQKLQEKYTLFKKVKETNDELVGHIDKAEKHRMDGLSKAQKLHNEIFTTYNEGKSVISAQAKNDLEEAIRSLESVQVKVSDEHTSLPDPKQVPSAVVELTAALKKNSKVLEDAKESIRPIEMNEGVRAIWKSLGEEPTFQALEVYTDNKIDKIIIGSNIPDVNPELLKDYNCQLFYDFKNEYITYNKNPEYEEQKANTDNITTLVNKAKEEIKKDDKEQESSERGKKSVSSDQLHYADPKDGSLFGAIGDIFDVITNFELSIDGAKKFFNAVGNIIKFFADFKTEVKKFLSNVINNIYINEYIIGSFDSEVSLKGDFKSEMNLRYETKQETTFLEDNLLDYEVEYVVVGKLTDQENRKGVGNRILFLRMIPNSTYLLIYESAFITKMATALSFGIAFLAPIISFVILIGWAFAESYFDLKRLRMGRRVPFFKTPGNFLLSKEGIKNVAKIFADDAKDALGNYIETNVDKVSKDVEEKMNEVADGINLKMDELSQEAKEELKQETQRVVDSLNAKYQSTKSVAISYVTNSLNEKGITDSMIKELKEEIGEDNYKELERLAKSKSADLEKNVDQIVESKLSGYKEKIDTAISEEIDNRVKFAKEKLEEQKQKLIKKKDELADSAKGKLKNLANSGVDKAHDGFINIFDNAKTDLYKSDTNIKTKSNLNSDLITLSYKDYLRFLLFFTGDDAKNQRIVNLHRMHGLKKEDWDTKELGAYVEVEATYEVKYLFIPTVVSILKGGGLGGSEKTKSVSDVGADYTFKVQSLIAY